MKNSTPARSRYEAANKGAAVAPGGRRLVRRLLRIEASHSGRLQIDFDRVQGESGLELSAMLAGRNQGDLGAEQAAYRVLNSATEKITRLDSRIGRSLERAIVVHYELQRRDLGGVGETNPNLGSGV